MNSYSGNHDESNGQTRHSRARARFKTSNYDSKDGLMEMEAAQASLDGNKDKQAGQLDSMHVSFSPHVARMYKTEQSPDSINKNSRGNHTYRK